MFVVDRGDDKASGGQREEGDTDSCPVDASPDGVVTGFIHGGQRRGERAGWQGSVSWMGLRFLGWWGSFGRELRLWLASLNSPGTTENRPLPLVQGRSPSGKSSSVLWKSRWPAESKKARSNPSSSLMGRKAAVPSVRRDSAKR